MTASKNRNPQARTMPVYGYYGSGINDAFVNGAKGEPSLEFDKLKPEEKDVWDACARSEGCDTLMFYNEYGNQIVLSQLQTFLIMKLQEKYNQQVDNNSNWKKADWMRDGTGDYGIVYTNSCELSREIYGTAHGNRLCQIQKAIADMATAKFFIAYYTRDYHGKLVLRVEKSPLITYGIDVADKRHKVFSWIRLHPAFFSRLRNRHIRCCEHTERLSRFFGYRLPTMASMILLRFLMKFGMQKEQHIEVGATKLMKMLCPKELEHRRRKMCREIVRQACEACKHVGIISSYDDSQIGRNGEIKYSFEMNSSFVRKSL